MAEMVSGLDQLFFDYFLMCFNFKISDLSISPKCLGFEILWQKNTPTFSGQSFWKAPHSIANERSFSTLLLRSEHIKGRESYGRNGFGFGSIIF
jgi:hypothetical protein